MAASPTGPKGRPSPARSNTVWLVAAGLGLLALAQALMLAPQGRPIPYSEFKQLGPQRPGGRGLRRRDRNPRHAQEGRRSDRLHGRPHRRPDAGRRSRGPGREVQRRAGQPVVAGADWLDRADPAAGGAVVVLHAADRRRGRHHVVRPQQGENLRRGRRQGLVQGRRRRRRGRAGAARDRRVPQEPEEVHDARRPHSQGRAAGGPAGHRQDAARPGRGRRGPRPVLQPERLGVRRDVRRRRRRPGPRPVLSGRGQGAVHRVHRRARRAGQGPVAGPGRQPRGARADSQPAAVGDGRVRRPQGHHHHGRHQPARGARSGAAPPGAVRSPGAGGQARREGARGGPDHPCPSGGARPRRGPAHGGQAHRRVCRRRPGQPGQRGGTARGQARSHPGHDARLRRRHRPADRRAREEAGDEQQGARDRRLPRVGPRHRRHAAAGARPGAQDLDRPARLRGAGLHHAAAARRSLPDAARRSGPAAGRAAGRALPPRRSPWARSPPAPRTICSAPPTSPARWSPSGA